MDGAPLPWAQTGGVGRHSSYQYCVVQSAQSGEIHVVRDIVHLVLVQTTVQQCNLHCL